MAKSGSSRLARSVTGTGGKLRGNSEPVTPSASACIEALRDGEWTPGLDANLLDAPDLVQLAPETVSLLVTAAGHRNDPNLWRLSAAVAERRNEDQDAIRYATEALNLQPNDVGAMALLARFHEKLADSVASAQWHGRIVDIDPQHTGSNRALARLHYNRGEYDTAIQHLSRLLELEPKARANKLYWLLATVKSVGLHGLAQPLTEARRWRNLSEEEESLAHELFVIVGKQCLQTKQRARAKQYLVRARQLAPSAEIETLLAELSEQLPGPDPGVRPAPRQTGATMPQDFDATERLAAVLLTDTRSLSSKLWDLFSSGVGISTALLAVAVVVLWAVANAPEQRSLPEDARVVAPAVVQHQFSPSRAEPELMRDKKGATQEQPAAIIASNASTSSSSAPQVSSPQPAEKSNSKTVTSPSAQETATGAAAMFNVEARPTSPSPPSSGSGPALSSVAPKVVDGALSPVTSNTRPGGEQGNSVPLTEKANSQEETLAAFSQDDPPQRAMQAGPEVSTAERSGDKQEVSTRRDDAPSGDSSTSSVPSASAVIARLSAQAPYTSQFPTRERVVSVPPAQLLPTVTALMRRETGEGRVDSRRRGVLRARVSGKRPKVSSSGAKTYGQYFVEVLPGPQAGTSRVRAKVIMLDWFTGRPVGDANTLAERFLNKVPQ